MLTAFLFVRKTISSKNIHNTGPLQQEFHSCPLENAYDLSILNTLTPEIKLLLYSLPNLFYNLQKLLNLLHICSPGYPTF